MRIAPTPPPSSPPVRVSGDGGRGHREDGASLPKEEGLQADGACSPRGAESDLVLLLFFVARSGEVSPSSPSLPLNLP